MNFGFGRRAKGMTTGFDLNSVCGKAVSKF